jgi:hypothetical protein
LFYNHHNREGDVIVISFSMGIHQGDLLGGALFVLVNFKVLHFIINHFPSCLLPSIVDDIHIIGPLLIVLFTYDATWHIN